MTSDVEVKVRFPVDDEELTHLHARAFGSAESGAQPWARRLQHYSVAWVGAFDGSRLVGFVHASGDGGAHAFLLDAAVDPAYRRRGIGRALVTTLRTEVSAAGCEWLHVDYEPTLESFYTACGFRPTSAGLIHLA